MVTFIVKEAGGEDIEKECRGGAALLAEFEPMPASRALHFSLLTISFRTGAVSVVRTEGRVGSSPGEALASLRQGLKPRLKPLTPGVIVCTTEVVP